MDFTEKNEELTDEILGDTARFTEWVNNKLQENKARFGIGGYNEHRTIYSRSKVFDGKPPLTPPTGENSAQPLPGDAAIRNSDSLNVGELYQAADPLTYDTLKKFVSELRKNGTKAEKIMWDRLRGDRLKGYSFRRQHIIGNFIVDFVCLAKKLVIEIDGNFHQLPAHQISDEDRTLWLQMKGYKVIRFTNDQVLFQINIVLNTIAEALDQLPFVEKRNFGTAPQNQIIDNSSEEFINERSANSSPVGGSRMGASEARRLHLGIDIWGAPYTKVMAPLDGIVHSFAFNNAFGDYGATVILTHHLDGLSFHSLYGHLSLNSLKNLHDGDVVRKGDVFAEFGIPFENGQWPPHLHFQLIMDLQGMKGDYPGVCKFSEREMYLANCPDPDLILGMISFAK
jgi:very-short-patch-repair endonuclease